MFAKLIELAGKFGLFKMLGSKVWLLWVIYFAAVVFRAKLGLSDGDLQNLLYALGLTSGGEILRDMSYNISNGNTKPPETAAPK